MKTKRCSVCKKRKSINKFHFYRGLKRRADCGECKSRKDVKSKRKRLYGVSSGTYETMLLSQEYLCKICRGKPKTRSLCVDHDHNTGKVRGLLCHNCNRAISIFDKKDLLKKALAYLKGK